MFIFYNNIFRLNPHGFSITPGGDGIAGFFVLPQRFLNGLFHCLVDFFSISKEFIDCFLFSHTHKKLPLIMLHVLAS